MRITSKGQVTIPIEIREKAGLLPNAEVVFEFDGTAVRILPNPTPTQGGRAGLLLSRLKGSATVKMTTDQIMAATRRR
ncbi:MAG TPA: AbrB/MazE/SpoVT family DNA-binding domain-containing protein [Holophaga sp.]|nr:AbrB/MazE/SpoVT family DNA-binding domain-containing protein [Holophaga sp.]